VGEILVVDDRPELSDVLARTLRRRGHHVETQNSAEAALKHARDHMPDVVLTDLRMPGISGLELLREFREMPNGPTVIMMTAYGSVETAVEAMQLGAFHYVMKPFNLDEVCIVIEKALERRRIDREVEHLREEVGHRYDFENIIARSASMLEVFNLVRRVAPTNSTVLITGSSGTGKELIARAVHTRSLRRRKPFVSINCTALPDSLLESELFGHVKGAFTGAIAGRRGLFEEGNGGTIFLDEIGEISPSLQQRLLRVLQERTFFRVGDSRERAVDVRVLAATNRDLLGEVNAGRFREDLYYRLNVVNIHIPPLRERIEDVPLLVDHFLRLACEANGIPLKKSTPEVLKILSEHSWPGNVRELQNTIERAAVLSSGEKLTPRDLPAEIGHSSDEALLGWAKGEQVTLAELERRHILATLEAVGGSRLETAQRLGIDRKTLWRRLREYGLDTTPTPTSQSREI
jgi:DNA-binding NtrC family response regulator